MCSSVRELVVNCCCEVGDLFISDCPKGSCQSPKSGTNSNRTSGSIRCTRDMEMTCVW